MDLTNINKDRKKRTRSVIDVASMVYGKVPPQAKSLEEAVLGALMLAPGSYLQIGTILKAEHFYVDAHQRIFECIHNLQARNLPHDILMVVEELKVMGWLDIVGGPYYVTKLTDKVTSTAELLQHSLIILQNYVKRRFIKLGGDIVTEAYEDNTDYKDIGDYLSAEFDDILKHVNAVSFQDYNDIIAKAVEEIITNDGTKPPAIPSPFRSLNEIILGFFSHLYIIAARPAMGKTAMLVTLVEFFTKVLGIAVGVLELETTSNAFAYRHLSGKTGISTDKMREGALLQEDIDKVTNAAQEIANQKLYIDFNSEQDLNGIRTKLRYWQKKYGIGIGLIDYIQIAQANSEDERKTREQQVSKIAYGLAAISKELDMPLIAFAQMSREVLKRAGNKPTLGDLRESGGIEAAARVVIAIHRPEYYEITADDLGESTKGRAELIVLKNNEGKIGTADVLFQGHLSRFANLDDYYHPDIPANYTKPAQFAEKIKEGWSPIVDTDKFDDEDAPF